MILIKEIVRQALATGYLSATARQQMRSLLQTNYDSEDIDAFIILERAVAAGDVKSEAETPVTKTQDTSSNIKLAYQLAAELAYAAALGLTMQHNT